MYKIFIKHNLLTRDIGSGRHKKVLATHERSVAHRNLGGGPRWKDREIVITRTDVIVDNATTNITLLYDLTETTNFNINYFYWVTVRI